MGKKERLCRVDDGVFFFCRPFSEDIDSRAEGFEHQTSICNSQSLVMIVVEPAN